MDIFATENSLATRILREKVKSQVKHFFSPVDVTLYLFSLTKYF